MPHVDGMAAILFLYVTGQMFSCSATLVPQEKKIKQIKQVRVCIRQHLGSLVKLGNIPKTVILIGLRVLDDLSDMAATKESSVPREENNSVGFKALPLNPENSSLLR